MRLIFFYSLGEKSSMRLIAPLSWEKGGLYAPHASLCTVVGAMCASCLPMYRGGVYPPICLPVYRGWCIPGYMPPCVPGWYILGYMPPCIHS